MEKILSLDISSATIGWGLLTKSKDKIILIDSGFIKPQAKDKELTLSPRLSQTYEQINDLLSKTKPDKVIIEDYAKKFSKGKSSANTIIVLAAFNETVALACYNFLKKEVIRMSVNNIRNIVSKHTEKNLDGKDDVVNFISSYFSIAIELNRNEKIKKEFYDRADAILAGLAYLLM